MFPPFAAKGDSNIWKRKLRYFPTIEGVKGVFPPFVAKCVFPPLEDLIVTSSSHERKHILLLKLQKGILMHLKIQILFRCVQQSLRYDN